MTDATWMIVRARILPRAWRIRKGENLVHLVIRMHGCLYHPWTMLALFLRIRGSLDYVTSMLRTIDGRLKISHTSTFNLYLLSVP